MTLYGVHICILQVCILKKNLPYEMMYSIIMNQSLYYLLSNARDAIQIIDDLLMIRVTTLSVK